MVVLELELLGIVVVFGACEVVEIGGELLDKARLELVVAGVTVAKTGRPAAFDAALLEDVKRLVTFDMNELVCVGATIFGQIC